MVLSQSMVCDVALACESNDITKTIANIENWTKIIIKEAIEIENGRTT